MKKIKNNNKQVQQTSKPKNMKLIIGIASVLVLFLIGGVIFEFINRPVILTINDDKYDMSDLGFYFYATESQYNYYNQMMGGTYWDMTVDKTKGTTMRDQAKTEAVDSALSTEVLYREAKAKDYKLTDKEKKTISDNVSSLLKGQIPKEVQDKNNFTKSYLTNIYNKQTLGNRYRDDVIKTLNIDDQKITAGVSKEDNRQYDLEYLFISTQKTDATGKSTPMSDAEKKAAYAKIYAVYPQSKTTKDWTTLIPKGEKDLIDTKGSFTAKDTTTSFTEGFRNTMMKLANNQVSSIYEDNTGYYIVRMLNNNSPDSYKDAVKQAITDAENKAFDEYYNKLLKNYKYTINNKELKKYKMGEITLTNK